MQNLSLRTIVESFTKSAPGLLLAIAVLTFIGVGVLQTDFYTAVFSPRFGGVAALVFSVFLAIIHEGARLALLVSSVRDFNDSRPGNGWLGLVGSVALVGYDIKIAAHVAQLWAQGSDFAPTLYTSTFVFLVLLGLILEVRIILTYQPKSKGKPNAGKARQNGRSTYELEEESEGLFLS